MTLAAATALALGACGGGGDGGGDEQSGGGATEIEARDVHLSMVDNAYSPATVDVETGETVRFVFHNDGSVRHDAVLGDAATQAMHEEEVRAAGEGAEAAEAMDHGFAPAITLQPGEVGEIVHTFEESEQLVIGCHEPGHYDAGMQIAVNVG
jgi:uncharacterized cupredoxin-like copper-binding protein